jgi:hypothetical protein
MVNVVIKLRRDGTAEAREKREVWDIKSCISAV